MFECPVCQYPGLDVKPYALWPPPQGIELVPPYERLLGRPSYEVCPCCGFEFGNDDNPGTGQADSFESYRRDWIKAGQPVFDRSAVSSQHGSPEPVHHDQERASG
jgi:hypothetical protein